MTTAIDLFAGFGGWSTGARAEGVKLSLSGDRT
jgi:site-specific DNA-cytosine methylase